MCIFSGTGPEHVSPQRAPDSFCGDSGVSEGDGVRDRSRLNESHLFLLFIFSR